MLRVTVLAVGRLKEKFWRDACAEYEKRLSGFCRLEIIEIEEARCPDRPSPAQIAEVVEQEGRRMLARIPKGAHVFALCIEGAQQSSEELAASLERLAASGTSHAAFLIGGSWGLSDAVKAAAHTRLSMSRMTFPHMLARVMLLEQLYRAGQIIAGGSYHK